MLAVLSLPVSQPERGENVSNKADPKTQQFLQKKIPSTHVESSPHFQSIANLQCSSDNTLTQVSPFLFCLSFPLSGRKIGSIQVRDELKPLLNEVSLTTLLEILMTQSAETTIKGACNHFNKWKTFAEANNYAVLPPVHEHEMPRFEAQFDSFVLAQYNAHENRYIKKSDTTRPNKPAAFQAVFTGINHVLVNYFDKPVINTRILTMAKKSYTRRYSKPVKKAKALEIGHLRNLIRLAKITKLPYVQLIVKVITVGWFGAGRFGCISNLDVAKTLHHVGAIGVNPDPSGKFSHLYWERKFPLGLSATVIPHMDDPDLDPRTQFLNVVSMFKRTTSFIPRLYKRGGNWCVDPNPNVSASYGPFLRCFRDVMSMAGNTSVLPETEEKCEEWSLHCNRRGFVRTARSAAGKTPLNWEVICRHGGWSPTTFDQAFSYNDIAPETHAEVMRSMYNSVLYGGSSTSSNATGNINHVADRKRAAPDHTSDVRSKRGRHADLEGQHCFVKRGNFTLRARLALQVLPGSSHYSVVLDGKTQVIRAEFVTLVPR